MQRQIEGPIRRKTRRILRIVFLLFANYCLNLRNKKLIEGTRRKIIGTSNESAFPEDKKSDCPIILLWQDKQVGRTNQSSSYGPSSVLANQSSSTDHLSVSANQILRTDLSTDHLSVLANHILWTGLSTDHLPYWPIRSFGVSSAEITKRSSHLNGHRPHELTRQKPFT